MLYKILKDAQYDVVIIICLKKCKNMIEIYKYMQHNNFDFIFYRPQNKFLSYSATFIIKGKKYANACTSVF